MKQINLIKKGDLAPEIKLEQLEKKSINLQKNDKIKFKPKKGSSKA
jgi:hypothetical protein